MEEAVAKLLTPDVVQEAARRFGTTADALTPLEAFENYVYALDTPAGGRILRLTHASHRARELLQAELEWLVYLTDNGARVARVLPSESGGGSRRSPLRTVPFTSASLNARPVSASKRTIRTSGTKRSLPPGAAPSENYTGSPRTTAPDTPAGSIGRTRRTSRRRRVFSGMSRLPWRG